eukprot:Clim_evm13s88 gene=Clim_evmTU13s88
MKYNYILALVFALVVACLADPIRRPKNVWQLCDNSGSDLLTIENLEVDPVPVKAGSKMSATLEGTLSETVTAGKLVLDVVFADVLPIQLEEDLCHLTDRLKCPIQKGPFKLDVDVNVPKFLPSGRLTGTATIVNQTGARVACVTLDVPMKNPHMPF